MKIQTSLETKIRQHFSPLELEIENESHKHSSGLGAESHFRVLIVSDLFSSQSRVARQRSVFDLLSEEMKSIHALSLRLLTPEEWNVGQGENFQSPSCAGKHKH